MDVLHQAGNNLEVTFWYSSQVAFCPPDYADSTLDAPLLFFTLVEKWPRIQAGGDSLKVIS